MTDTPSYHRHLRYAEAKTRTYAIDAFAAVEELTGWAHTAQLDKAILDATVQARAAIRRVRNLLLPDETFSDDPDRSVIVKDYNPEFMDDVLDRGAEA